VKEMTPSVFKSEEKKEKFRTRYAAIVNTMPVTQKYVETAFGQTFLLQAGEAGKLPVILLHGSCSNSVFWLPELMALSENYCVYAVDIIGEAGNSEAE
jgi:pimeloyl-ACP methyl ester carboxylesterase